MTLTDIISKVTRYAKKVIVTDNSSSAAANIVQSGSGDGATITSSTGTGASITTTGTGASITTTTGTGASITSSTGTGALITTNTGTALRIQKNHTNPVIGGTLEFFPTTGDIVFDGGSDGVFVFKNTSSATTKAIVFEGANVGINTLTPIEALDVEGKVRIKNECIVNGANQTFRFFALNTNNIARWHIGASNDNETGADVGSDFFIHRFNDAGTFISRVIEISRSTGRLSVNGSMGLQGLQTFANNAAALAGGLVVNDVYKNAAGELRIVV